jgi:phage gp46-like protein
MDILTAYGSWSTDVDYRRSADGLVTDSGLATAVLISLFTDRRADPDDTMPDGETDRRGWWGDVVPLVAGYPIGSRLWLLARSKDLPEVLVLAKAYAEEALAWMIAAGAASRVEVEAVTQHRGLLQLNVRITRPARPDAETYQFQWSALSPAEEV